jgi:hypothetical protein
MIGVYLKGGLKPQQERKQVANTGNGTDLMAKFADGIAKAVACKRVWIHTGIILDILKKHILPTR